MEIMEMVRHLRAGESERKISQVLGLSRNTVARYRAWAKAEGFLEGELPDLARLEQARVKLGGERKPGAVMGQGRVAGWQSEIEALQAQGCRPRQIWGKLGEIHQQAFTLSERSVQRVVEKLRQVQATPKSVVRIETQPGEEAQADFGYAGQLRDPQTGAQRKAWMFVLVLSWSRHMYAELVFDQQLATWLACHMRSFAWFGGVPERVVIDNLKTAIIRAYVQDRDPEVQRAYREQAEHYGFLISPCLPGRPEHKGKVERGGVAYLASSFLPLLPEGCDLNDGNRRLQVWLREQAGQRVHGTTKQVPLERFTQVERAALLPVPAEPYDPALWKQSKLHRDGYVVLDGAYYSAPSRLVGQVVWIRAGLTTVRLFT
jgi:transposase